jgi:hypothetical protein
MKKGLLLALAAAPLLALVAPRAHSVEGTDDIVTLPIGIQNEPVLIYDLSGGTLLGPVRRTLTLYDTGAAAYSNFDGFLTAEAGFGDAGTATYFQVSIDEVQELIRKMVRAGALKAGDGTPFVADVPLTTISFVDKPAAQATIRTFSFYLGQTPAQIQTAQVVNEFLAAHVPLGF